MTTHRRPICVPATSQLSLNRPIVGRKIGQQREKSGGSQEWSGSIRVTKNGAAGHGTHKGRSLPQIVLHVHNAHRPRNTGRNGRLSLTECPCHRHFQPLGQDVACIPSSAEL